MTAMPVQAEPIGATVSVRELKHAIKLAKPFVATRSSIMALQHVKLDSFGIHATNMDAHASVPCNLYGIESCLVRPADLLAALKGLGVRDSVSVVVDGPVLRVNGCALPTHNLEDWPAFPELSDSMLVRDVPSGFADALRDVATHTSTDESRPVLTGVHVVGTADRIELAATDSYRLAGMSLPASMDATSAMTALIPVNGGKYLRHVADVIRWEQDHRFVRMDCSDGARYVLRRIDGVFPDWRKLVPACSEYVSDLSSIGSGLLRTLEQASKMSKRNPVRLTFDPRGSFNVELRQHEGPELDATWNLDWSDESFVIGVHPAYLADAIRFVGDDVSVGMISPLRPIVVGSQDPQWRDSFRFSLVMPIRLPE